VAVALPVLASACTGGEKEAAKEPVVSASAAAADVATSAGDDEPIAAAAVADTDPDARKSVEDVVAPEVDEDLTTDVQPPQDLGASLSQLKGGASPASAATPDTAAAGDEELPPTEAEYLWVFADKATVRAEPSSTAKRVGTIEYGDKVEVFETKGGFVRVGEGKWVARKLLTDRKAKFGKGQALPAH
jgi:hypothetical protein